MDEQTIFTEALEKQDPVVREAFLEQACVGHPGLRQRIERLLNQHEDAGSFLESPAPELAATTAEPITEGPGTVIDPYKLLQQVGEGGMGTVWMAEQTQPVQRKVALKVIKPGMDSRQVVARFEAERQALAMMDHVNIARVFDGGTTENGRPYFVMELVHGVPITNYCDDNHLTPRERLELFVPVCQAIQHAHQKGIIHRDIKPSNVMITLYDGKPVPKVIDFGVAKATEQKLTERTLFTQYGTMVGTLEYMSPEQAEMSALGVDTRSDIYSLGVMLYELLTGNTPLTHKTMKEAAYAEILRMIKEEEPPKPSTRLSDSGEALASISASRHTEPAKLTKLVKGELDWIVMKTLEKDRNRRYETAKDFAADLQRYLNDEPVLACPPSAWYRFRKFARRNKRMLATAGVIMVALVLGTAISVWQAIRATEAERLAEARLKTAKEAQQQSAESLKDALAAVDQMLTQVGQEHLVNVPQMEPVRRELLQDALKFYQKFLQKNSNDPLIRRETAMAYRRLADIYRNLGQYAEAETGYRKGFAMFTELAAHTPLEPSTRRDLSLAHLELGNCLSLLGKREEHAKSIQRAAQIAEQLVMEYPNDPNHADMLVDATYHLAALTASSRPEEAEKMLRRNLTLTNTPYLRANIHRYLGSVLTGQKRSKEAEQATRQALKEYEKLASENPSSNPKWVWGCIGETLNHLATLVAADGRLPEAEEIFDRAISVLDKLATDYPAGPNYRNTQAYSHQGRASLLRSLNRTQEAEQAYRRALDLFVKLAADFPTINGYQQTALEQRLNLGQFLVETGRPEDALDVYFKAVDLPGIIQSDVPAKLNHWHGLVRTHVELGRLLAKGGKTEQAESAYRRAVEIQENLEREFADQLLAHPDLAQSHHHAANLLSDAGWLLEAEKLYGYAIAHLRKLVAEFPTVPEHRVNLGHAHNALGWLLARSDRLREREQEHRLSLALFEQLVTDFPSVIYYQSERAEVLQTIANLVRDQGDLAAARPLMEAATTYAQSALQAEPRNRIYSERVRRDRKELIHLLVQLGESAQAEETLRDALADSEKQAAESVAEEDSMRALAEARTALAVFLRNVGQSKEAEHFSRLALNSYDKLVTEFPKVPEYQEHLSRCHVDLAYWVKDSLPRDAENAYRQAIAIQEKLVADYPDVVEYRKTLISRYIENQPPGSLGEFLFHTGRVQESESVVRRSLEILDELPAAGDWQRSRKAHCLRHLAFRIWNKLPECEEAFGEAAAMFQELAKEFPQDSHYPYFEADSLQRIGMLLSDTRPEDSQKAYQEALQVWEMMIVKYPLGSTRLDFVDSAHRSKPYILKQLGRMAEAEQAYRLAICQYEELAAKFPNLPNYRNELAHHLGTLANLLESNRQATEAIGYYQQAVELRRKLTEEFPNEPNYQNDLAALYGKLGQWNQAIAVYSATIADKPDFAEGWELRGIGYSQKGEWSNAVADFAKAIQLEPSRWQGWSGRAFVHFNQQQWEEAIIDFSKAIDLAPQVHTNWWHRGHTYLQFAQWDKAAEDFGKVVDQWPDGAEGWYWRGVAFAQLNQPEKAIADFRQAIAKGFNAPGRIKNDSSLAPLRSHDDFDKLLDELEQQEKKKRDDAIGALRKAIELDPKSAKVHNQLGAALRAQGSLDEAIACHRKAIELDPKSASGHNHLGYTLQALGKLDEAIAWYRASIELDPKSAWTHNALGKALKDHGKLDEAIAVFRKAVEFDPNPRAAHTNLAWWLATDANPMFRDPKAAVAHARKAIDLAPEDPNHWSNLGVALWRAGDLKSAVETLEKADRMYKDGDQFHRFFLAMAYWQFGEKDKARQAYGQAVEWMDKHQPKNEELRRFRAEAEELLGESQKKM